MFYMISVVQGTWHVTMATRQQQNISLYIYIYKEQHSVTKKRSKVGDRVQAAELHKETASYNIFC